MLKNLLKKVQRPELDFSSLKKPRKPNTYLMSPPDYCQYPPKTISPIYEISTLNLAGLFETVALAEPRTEKLGSREIGKDLQVDYVQYSKLIGYPDTVTVRFIDLGEGRSTLAVFSRAHYGYRDFGVNEARVKDWMRKLDLAVKKGAGAG
ncbi:DUF1499 domain-containing protein [Sneathiella sp. HT1-7]|jgi:uncharacterized protein (DUF1499 family)|uniref:DUF1499 domain-containing protein n=1 Tax=Sneathiella sp. HT1-7 TaxID=2887192 RepID=UPI001D136AFF|nr:DUF1499 domain-containing protein [Sneathiella sp. HT1-7]MCC3306458.1 DUF1499 domain-containing protein [Sneathiella sp. HT1-7]